MTTSTTTVVSQAIFESGTAAYRAMRPGRRARLVLASRPPVHPRIRMSRALTPELAPAYLRALSADVRAVAVLDASGALLAGDPDALAEAERLLDQLPPGGERMLRRDARRPHRPRHPLALLAAAGSRPPDAPLTAAGSRRSGELLAAARSGSHAVVVVCGPHALRGLVLGDLRRVLRDLEASAWAPGRSDEAREAARFGPFRRG